MKKLLSLLVLSSLVVCPVTNVYATDGQTNLTKEVQQQKASEEKALRLNIPHLQDGERLQVSKGSNLDLYGIDLYAYYIEKSQITTYAYLENSMVSNFDNTKLGDQDVTVNYDGATTVLPITVIDGQAPGQVTSIKVNKDEITVPLDLDLQKFDYLPQILLYDALGREVVGRRMSQDYVASGYDISKFGKQKVTIDYKGLKTDFTLNVVKTCAIATPQRVAIGGKLNDMDVVKIVDVNDNENVVSTVPIYNAFMGAIAGTEDPENAWFNKIDTSNSGVQTIEFKFEDLGIVYTTTIDVIVGIPEAAELPESAKATIPTKNDVLGTWSIPLGTTGAGKWYFNTELAGGNKLDKGTNVDVFYYLNDKWSKIGTFTIDENGNALVGFTEEQLEVNFEDAFASVLLTKSDDKLKNDKDSTSETTSGSESASVKTGDKAGIALYGTVAMIVIAGMSYVLYSKKKRV